MTAIQIYRERAGLTQVMLAEKLGVTQSAVSFWENGERKPDIYMLKKISIILNCTTDELLGVRNLEWIKEDKA